MKIALIGLAAASVLAFGVAGCSKEREAKVDTGTATAVVKTEAPPEAVPAAQLQQTAQQAATAASTPVDGSGPLATTTPPVPAPAAK